MEWIAVAKRRVALRAVEHVRNGQIVGLGTGSTAYYAIQEMSRRIRDEGLKIMGVPTSNQSARLAKSLGIPLTSLNRHERIDLAIDGADQVDPELNLIKGMGGALTREKIVDSSADLFIVIVDSTKLTQKLGSEQAIPVEVLPFAEKSVSQRIRVIGGESVLRLTSTGRPYLTDNGNHIIDVDFGEIENVNSLEKEINLIPGVLENGLFINLAHIAYAGYKTKIERMEGKKQ